MRTTHPPGKYIYTRWNMPAVANHQFTRAEHNRGAPIFCVLARIVQQIIKDNARQFLLPTGQHTCGNAGLQHHGLALLGPAAQTTCTPARGVGLLAKSQLPRIFGGARICVLSKAQQALARHFGNSTPQQGASGGRARQNIRKR